MRAKTGYLKNCETCNGEFRIIPYLERIGKGRFCSRPCIRLVGVLPYGERKKLRELGLDIQRKGEEKGRVYVKREKIYAKRFTKEQLLERKRFRNQRYKARKREALGSHTFDEWLALKLFYKSICLCCKRQEPEIKLTEDHIMPLSLGGTDYIHNIQPLCGSCNTRKHAKFISYLPSSDSLIYMEKGA